jgi:hypothetical protein
VDYCLRQGGRHAEANHIRLMLDCVEICQTSADFMIRASDLHKHTCAACAAVCDRCAQDCASFTDSAEMQRCADMCKRCADSCRQMAA